VTHAPQTDYNACQLARYTHLLAWFTAALAFATILLIVVGIIQARQLSRHAAHTENLVATARDTAERQLRAYLQVTPDQNSVVWINTVHIPACRVFVKNAGQTPAYEVQADGAINPAPFPLREPLSEFLSPEEQFRLVIHPGEGHTINFIGDRLLTEDEVDRLVPGKDLRLYLYGQVRYKDAFGKDRYTRFRMSTGSEVRDDQSRFGYCDQGNEAT
jgi:hypothetical protein